MPSPSTTPSSPPSPPAKPRLTRGELELIRTYLKTWRAIGRHHDAIRSLQRELDNADPVIRKLLLSLGGRHNALGVLLEIAQGEPPYTYTAEVQELEDQVAASMAYLADLKELERRNGQAKPDGPAPTRLKVSPT